MSKNNAGYFRGGIPYNKFGSGPRILVIFQGLLFENKPISGFMAKKFAEMYDSLNEDYTVFIVTRKPGLPEEYSLADMADDYAKMIKEEFGGPVDVLGVSTGGSIAQHFAADHPDLVHRLVIHSSAYTLKGSAKEQQMLTGRLARQKKWRAAYAEMMGVSSLKGAKRLLKPFFLLVSLFGGSIFGRPDDPSDLVITIEAEDKFNFKDRLTEIKAPTLVTAGGKDPFYTEKLFRETAKDIPNARLILYKGIGHPASGKQFKKDLKAFLDAEGV
jgi:pimeloyl-ACP methyl ester carboxylesterase